MTEQWKQFTESKYKSYYISTLGQVKSVDKCVLINHKWHRINRLVAEAFIPNPHNKPEVNHIIPVSRGGADEVNNLEWVTRSENRQHAIDNDLIQQHITLVLNKTGEVISEHNTKRSAFNSIDYVTINPKSQHKYNGMNEIIKTKHYIIIAKDCYESLNEYELNEILLWANKRKSNGG